MPFAFRTQWICESLFIIRIIDRIINYEISISGNDRTQIAETFFKFGQFQKETLVCKQ